MKLVTAESETPGRPSEDAQPLAVDLGDDWFLLAAFDGVGGSGADLFLRKSSSDPGPYTGAYFASRIAKNSLATKDGPPTGALEAKNRAYAAAERHQPVPLAVAQHLHSVFVQNFKHALETLLDKEATQARFRGALTLPTTAAIVLGRKPHWQSATAMVALWLGDSHAYAFSASRGLQFLTTEEFDPRSEGDRFFEQAIGPQGEYVDRPMREALHADSAGPMRSASYIFPDALFVFTCTDGVFDHFSGVVELEKTVLHTICETSDPETFNARFKAIVDARRQDDATIALAFLMEDWRVLADAAQQRLRYLEALEQNSGRDRTRAWHEIRASMLPEVADTSALLLAEEPLPQPSPAFDTMDEVPRIEGRGAVQAGHRQLDADRGVDRHGQPTESGSQRRLSSPPQPFYPEETNRPAAAAAQGAVRNSQDFPIPEAYKEFDREVDHGAASRHRHQPISPDVTRSPPAMRQQRNGSDTAARVSDPQGGRSTPALQQTLPHNDRPAATRPSGRPAEPPLQDVKPGRGGPANGHGMSAQTLPTTANDRNSAVHRQPNGGSIGDSQREVIPDLRNILGIVKSVAVVAGAVLAVGLAAIFAVKILPRLEHSDNPCGESDNQRECREFVRDLFKSADPILRQARLIDERQAARDNRNPQYENALNAEITSLARRVWPAQNALYDLGFAPSDSGRDTRDGQWGPDTKAAWASYQGALAGIRDRQCVARSITAPRPTAEAIDALVRDARSQSLLRRDLDWFIGPSSGSAAATTSVQKLCRLKTFQAWLGEAMQIGQEFPPLGQSEGAASRSFDRLQPHLRNVRNEEIREADLYLAAWNDDARTSLEQRLDAYRARKSYGVGAGMPLLKQDLQALRIEMQPRLNELNDQLKKLDLSNIPTIADAATRENLYRALVDFRKLMGWTDDREAFGTDMRKALAQHVRRLPEVANANSARLEELEKDLPGLTPQIARRRQQEQTSRASLPTNSGSIVATPDRSVALAQIAVAKKEQLPGLRSKYPAELAAIDKRDAELAASEKASTDAIMEQKIAQARTVDELKTLRSENPAYGLRIQGEIDKIEKAQREDRQQKEAEEEANKKVAAEKAASDRAAEDKRRKDAADAEAAKAAAKGVAAASGCAGGPDNGYVDYGCREIAKQARQALMDLGYIKDKADPGTWDQAAVNGLKDFNTKTGQLTGNGLLRWGDWTRLSAEVRRQEGERQAREQEQRALDQQRQTEKAEAQKRLAEATDDKKRQKAELDIRRTLGPQLRPIAWTLFRLGYVESPRIEDDAVVFALTKAAGASQETDLAKAPQRLKEQLSQRVRQVEAYFQQMQLLRRSRGRWTVEFEVAIGKYIEEAYRRPHVAALTPDLIKHMIDAVQRGSGWQDESRLDDSVVDPALKAEAQSILTAAGIPVKPDGRWGDNSMEALKRFLVPRSLESDGTLTFGALQYLRRPRQ